VSYKWSKFIVEGSLYTDPMGLEIINYIDIRLDDHWVGSINVYFMCPSVMASLATLHSRVTQYQHQANLHPSLKRLSSQAFLEYLTQQRISPTRIKNWLVIVHGDFNRSLKFKINPTSLETWTKTNRLVNPDFEHL
jgi:hypothetical protein